MQTVIRNVDDNLELIEAEKGMFSKDDEFFLPVIIHNLKGYDSHLIIKHMRAGHMIPSVEFATVDENDEVVVEKVKDMFIIATNSDKYMGFQIGQVRFIDSMQFLNRSLDSLISTVAKDGMDKFIYTKRHFPDMGQFELVTRKGIFPYEWFNSAERFEETSLPVQDMFFSCLYEEKLSDDDYAHAQSVWKHLNFPSLRQYHDLYVKTDVLLLADVFENFRSRCHDYYGIDACHYWTLPGVSYDACLKMTGVELQLLTEPHGNDQRLFLQRGIRGGVSTITHRYAKANFDSMGADYNPNDPSKYLMYLDANNLYGHAMRQLLPVDGIKFLTDKEVLETDLTEKLATDTKG